ncbi:hypothetical protein REPUB_Repub07fG0174200 [Reevesia pubescens]
MANQEVSIAPKDDLGSNESSGILFGPETLVPSLRKHISTEPSPFLADHLVDIVYSYRFTLSVYNGDWQSDAIGSAMVHEQPREAWSSLAAIVKAEKSSFMDYVGHKSFPKTENVAENKGKVLIEEM